MNLKAKPKLLSGQCQERKNANIIIALAGQKQSGKSSACYYIRNICECLVIEYSFAALLKKFCIDVLGLRHEQCYGDDEEKNTDTQWLWDDVAETFREKYGKNGMLKFGIMTAREVMQVQGELQRNNFCNDVWVNALFNQIENNDKGLYFRNRISVISDVRHINEVEKCIEKNAFIIHLSKKTNDDVADSEIEMTRINWNDLAKQYNRTFIIDNSNMTIDQKNAVIFDIFANNAMLSNKLRSGF